MEPDPLYRYAVLDAEGNVTNVIVWDERSEFDPGPGFSLFRLLDDEGVEIGENVIAAAGVPEEPVGFFRRALLRLRRKR